MTVGDEGIILKSKEAKAEWEQATKNEQKSLDELYSSMLVATNDDSKITLSMEELKTVIKKEVQKAIETQDITDSLHLNTDYVERRVIAKMTKSGNTIRLTAYLTVLADIPANTPIITIDETYKPNENIVEIALVRRSSTLYKPN